METYLITQFTLTQQDHDDIENAIRVQSDVIDGLRKAGTNEYEIEILSQANKLLVKLNTKGMIE